MSKNRIHRIRILHISDLHTGIEPKENRKIVSKPGPGISVLIKRTLRKFRNRKSFDFLVITGDLIHAEGCTEQQLVDRYALADAEIRDIMTCMRIKDESRVLIVPGNQDSIRLNNKEYNPNGFDAYLSFVRSFYGDKPPIDFSILSPKEVDREGRLCTNYTLNPPRCCITTDKHVVFMPIFTASLNKSENRDGRLSDEEIQKCVTELFELRNTPDHKNDICIVLAHHNFLPVGPDRKSRKESVSSVRYGFPEHGFYYLQTLFADTVDIVLHGHRHYESILRSVWDTQDRFIERTGIVIGCQSTGYYEEGTVAASEHSLAGFRVLELIQSELRTRALVKDYSFSVEGGNWKFEQKCRDFTLKSVRGGREFMEFNEGYDRFITETLCRPVTGTTRNIDVFHYHNDTSWDNAYKRFWGLNANDKYKILRSLKDRWFKYVQNPDSVINQGYICPELSREAKMRKLDEAIHRAFAGEKPLQEGDYFEEHLRVLVKKGEENARSVAYISEALLCAAYSQCRLIKHVYICPQSLRNETEKNQKMKKFIWLCETILLVRKLTNFDITWLPYAIRNYRGKSLAGISTKKNGKAHDVYYVGFDVQPDSLSVLRLPPEDDRSTSAEGPILADLKAIISKVVHPLSDRHLYDFPFVKEGILYLANLHAMAIGVGCGDIWTSSYKTRVRDAFEENKIANDIQMADIKVKLKELYQWVGRTHREGSHIPWDAADMMALKSNIPEN